VLLLAVIAVQAWYLELIVALYASIVSEQLLLFDLYGSSRPGVLTEYVLVLLLIHDGIAAIMNGVFVISVLLLR